MKESDYIIKDIYQGGYSTFDSEKSLSPVNYSIPSGDFGLTTDFRSANILNEINTKLNTGIKHIEISPVQPEVFESIPKEYFKEAGRQAKLTGATITVHGSPQLEASGITNQGFNESSRKAVERQMQNVIERAHELNPDGSSPVTFHSSAGIPGQLKEKGQKEVEETLVINTETGSINRVPLKKSNFPGEPEEANINNTLEKQNRQAWTQNISHINYYAELGGEAVDRSGYIKYLSDLNKGKEISNIGKQARTSYNRGISYLEESYSGLKDLCDIAYRKGTSGDKEVLENFYKEINEKAEEIKKNKDNFQSIEAMKEIVQEGTEVLKKISPPTTVEPLVDFAKDRTTETFANIALDSYKKFQDKSPIISIENPPAGGAFSTGEELREIVEKSREKFVKKAVEEGMSESVAKNQAEKLIGVTWDVGHINMLRKYGYESKDIIKQSEEIKPLLKHVHLSDNFGFEHTELPMGMGNVPIKEIMEKLGKEGFEAKKIIEAGHWYQHFQSSPLQETLNAFGSPIYAMQMAPYWNQSQGFQQSYYGGIGPIYPDINYQTFGGSFSQLPQELGGQKPGASGGRMSGRPME